MYVPYELLEQVEKQVKAEFNGLITRYQWWHEDEYTTIVVEIDDITWDLRVEDRTSELIDEIIGDGYIVSLHLTPIERVGKPDDLFHLTYYGSGDTFFLDYYAPERARSNPLKASIYDTRMIKGMRRIYLDSPSELWGQLFRPIQETFAKRQGVHSFCKDLAPDLRDFLLEHMDFIQRMIQASGETLQILPAPVSPLPRNDHNGQKPSAARKHAPTSQQELLLQPAVAA
ncbi:MAG: hypothetical protein ACPGWR_02700 [Ardenticatenaceae bacterium]